MNMTEKELTDTIAALSKSEKEGRCDKAGISDYCDGEDVRSVRLKSGINVFKGDVVRMCSGCRRSNNGGFKFLEKEKVLVPEVLDDGELLPMTAEEAGRLAKLEDVISENMKGFLSVGHALAEINGNGLYREFGTFEKYLSEKWQIGRSYAYSQIGAAKVYDNLRASGAQILPTNESQIRPIARKLIDKPRLQFEAWEKACEGGMPTRKKVGEIVDGIIGSKGVSAERKRERMKMETPELVNAYEVFRSVILQGVMDEWSSGLSREAVAHNLAVLCSLLRRNDPNDRRFAVTK